MANLIVNPSVETDISGWSASRATLSRVNLLGDVGSSPGFGEYGIKVSTTSENGEAIQSVSGLPVGALCLVSVWAFSPSTNTSVKNAKLLISNESWSAIAQKSITQEDTWQKISIIFIATTSTIKIELRDTTTTPGDASYFDHPVLLISSPSVVYVDPSAVYDGDGTTGSQATADYETGAFNDFSWVNQHTGDLSGKQILLRSGETHDGGPVITGASDFSIGKYGDGEKSEIDSSYIFSGEWIAESNGIWYAPAESGKVYSRAIIINGERFASCALKSDLYVGVGRSWYDSENNRHYISLASDPNETSVKASSSESGRYMCIHLDSCSDYSISDVSVRFAHNSCIASANTGDNCEISYAVASGAGAHTGGGWDGIVVYGRGFGGTPDLAEGLSIHDVNCSGNLNNGIELWGVDGASVYNCDLSGNGGGIELWGHVRNSEFYNVKINGTIVGDNSLSQNAGRGIWATGVASAPPDTGYSSDNEFYNFSISNMRISILLSCGSGWNINSCTLLPVIPGYTDGIIRLSGATSASISNNIVVTDGAINGVKSGSIPGETMLSGSNNIFWSLSGQENFSLNGTAHTSLDSFLTASGITDSQFVDPKFVDFENGDYHLRPDSPAVGAGIYMGHSVDIEGNQLYPPYNIGAYGGTATNMRKAPLQHSGRVKYSLNIVYGSVHSDLVVKLAQAPELIELLGLDSDYFDASGVAKEIIWDSHADNSMIRFGTKGGVIYTTDRTSNEMSRIDRIIGRT